MTNPILENWRNPENLTFVKFRCSHTLVDIKKRLARLVNYYSTPIKEAEFKTVVAAHALILIDQICEKAAPFK